MSPMRKLLALTLVLLPVFTLGVRDAYSGACEDARDFCKAGCTSTSSSGCLDNCTKKYNFCKAALNPSHPPSGPTD